MPMRKSVHFLTLVVVGLAILISFSLVPSSDAQEDDAAAQSVLQMLNGWRIDQGIWPLRENPVLDRMALAQATYILSLPSIPVEGNIHLGLMGETPPQRARLPQYNWPDYNNDPQNTAVGEIAYVGASVSAARNFWENSTIHRNTVLNSTYREVGVAALPHKYGRLYFVDFGARPDVLPAIADTRTKTLYLSNERYSYARAPMIRNALQVRLFDADGRPLTDSWIDWKSSMPLPDTSGDKLYVEYTDGAGVMVLAEVPLDRTTSGGLPAVTIKPTSTPSLTPTLVPTIVPTSMPTPTQPGFRPNPPTPPPTPPPTLTPVVTTANNVLLLYDSRSFTLINSSSAPLNVQELVFTQGSLHFSVTRWQTQWLSGTLTALAGSDCLQAWSWTESSVLSKPSSCRQRRSVITLSPTLLFWKQGDFTVEWHGTTLATCHSSEDRCAFGLPS